MATYGKYTGYLTDPATGQKVAYDKRYSQQKERLAKKFREVEAQLAPLRRARAYYEPGGAFGTGVETAITRGRKKAVSVGAQELAGAGLAGTTMVGGLGTRYEEEVGMPARMSIEEERIRAMAGIETQIAGMGFERGQAATQMRFQAGQATQQRDLQRYIADLQAKLQREQMTMRTQPTAPTGGYAKQFPSLYNVPTQPSPTLKGGGLSGFGETPQPTMAPFGGAIYGTQEAFETYGLEPETGSVPMGRRIGPTIEEPPVPSNTFSFGPYL